MKKSVFLQAYLKHLQADMKKDNVIRKLIKLSLVVTSQSAIFFQQTAMIFRQIEGSMKDFQSIRDIKNNSELLLGTTLQHAFSTSQ